MCVQVDLCWNFSIMSTKTYSARIIFAYAKWHWYFWYFMYLVCVIDLMRMRRTIQNNFATISSFSKEKITWICVTFGDVFFWCLSRRRLVVDSGTGIKVQIPDTKFYLNNLLKGFPQDFVLMHPTLSVSKWFECASKGSYKTWYHVK